MIWLFYLEFILPPSKTKYINGTTIVKEDALNAFYGGKYNTKEAENLNPLDPLVAGHIHDGNPIDGHAQKINLTNHVTGSLLPARIRDGSIPLSALDLDIFRKSISLLILTNDGRLIRDDYGNIVIKEVETQFNYIITDSNGNLISDENGNIVIKEI